MRREESALDFTVRLGIVFCLVVVSFLAEGRMVLDVGWRLLIGEVLVAASRCQIGSVGHPCTL